MEAGWHTWIRHIRTVFHLLKKRRLPAFLQQSNISIAGCMTRG